MVIGRLYPAARTSWYSNRYRLWQRSREKCSARPRQATGGAGSSASSSASSSARAQDGRRPVSRDQRAAATASVGNSAFATSKSPRRSDE